MNSRETIEDIIRVYKDPPNPEYQMAHLEGILRSYVKSEVKKILFNLPISGSLPFTEEEKELIVNANFRKLKRVMKLRR